jgi:hypothetical protein
VHIRFSCFGPISFDSIPNKKQASLPVAREVTMLHGMLSIRAEYADLPEPERARNTTKQTWAIQAQLNRYHTLCLNHK